MQEDTKYSDRDYSYEALTSKPDMTVTTLPAGTLDEQAREVFAANRMRSADNNIDALVRDAFGKKSIDENRMAVEREISKIEQHVEKDNTDESDRKDHYRKKVKEFVAGGTIQSFKALPKEVQIPFSKGLEKANAVARTVLQNILLDTDIYLNENKKSMYFRGIDVVELNPLAEPSTFAHELFHRLDSKYGVSKSGELQKALERDFRQLKVDSEGDLKRYLWEQYPQIWMQTQKGDWILKKEYRGISDIFSGLTNDELNLGYHHKAAYWKRNKYNLSREAWAQFGRMLYENDSSVLFILKKLFPRFTNCATMRLEEVG